MTYTFKTQIARLGWTEAGAINLLVDAGIVSDQVLRASDIPKEDMKRAEEWLKIQKRKIDWE